MEVTVRQGRRCKQLMVDLEEMRRYCKLKEETLDLPLCRSRLGRGNGPVVSLLSDDATHVGMFVTSLQWTVSIQLSLSKLEAG